MRLKDDEVKGNQKCTESYLAAVLLDFAFAHHFYITMNNVVIPKGHQCTLLGLVNNLSHFCLSSHMFFGGCFLCEFVSAFGLCAKVVGKRECVHTCVKMSIY